MTNKKKHSVIEGLEDAMSYARQVNESIESVADMDPKDKRIKLLEIHLQKALDDRIPFAEKYSAHEKRKIKVLEEEVESLLKIITYFRIAQQQAFECDLTDHMACAQVIDDFVKIKS